MTSFFMAWPSHLRCYVWIYLKAMTNFNTHELVVLRLSLVKRFWKRESDLWNSSVLHGAKKMKWHILEIV